MIDDDDEDDSFQVRREFKDRRIFKLITKGEHAGKYVAWDPSVGAYTVVAPEFVPPLKPLKLPGDFR